MTRDSILISLKTIKKRQEEGWFLSGLVAENVQNLEYKSEVLRADIQDTGEDESCSELLLFGDKENS